MHAITLPFLYNSIWKLEWNRHWCTTIQLIVHAYNLYGFLYVLYLNIPHLFFHSYRFSLHNSCSSSEFFFVALFSFLLYHNSPALRLTSKFWSTTFLKEITEYYIMVIFHVMIYKLQLTFFYCIIICSKSYFSLQMAPETNKFATKITPLVFKVFNMNLWCVLTFLKNYIFVNTEDSIFLNFISLLSLREWNHELKNCFFAQNMHHTAFGG